MDDNDRNQLSVDEREFLRKFFFGFVQKKWVRLVRLFVIITYIWSGFMFFDDMFQEIGSLILFFLEIPAIAIISWSLEPIFGNKNS